MTIRLGLQPWNQAYAWSETVDVARRAEALGYDSLWTWEHPLACMGDPLQDTFDCYTLLAGWSQVTERVRLGVLTGANTLWNPGLLAKKVVTLDHLSGGRAICGLGAGWFELEHQAFGIDFGSGWGDRLGRLEESASALRRLLDGETVSSPAGGHYAFESASLHPRPIQDRLPLLIGGGGERKTLRTVARHADIWNWVATDRLEAMRAKHVVLERRCEEAGRDPATIERSAFLWPIIRDTEREAQQYLEMLLETNKIEDDLSGDPSLHVTTEERMVELMGEWVDIGVGTFILQMGAPFDDETAARFAGPIREAVSAR